MISVGAERLGSMNHATVRVNTGTRFVRAGRDLDGRRARRMKLMNPRSMMSLGDLNYNICSVDD